MILSELINSTEALSRLMQQPMKAKASFRLAKTVKQVQPHIEAFEETRTKIVEQYGKKNGEGFVIDPESKGWKKYVNELEDVLKEEIKLNVKKITLASIAQAEITAADAIILEWLVDE